MTKKRKENELIMHKLMGEHSNSLVNICTICGAVVGQDLTIEPYEAVHFTKDQISQLLEAINKLSERMRYLEIEFSRQHYSNTIQYTSGSTTSAASAGIGISGAGGTSPYTSNISKIQSEMEGKAYHVSKK